MLLLPWATAGEGDARETISQWDLWDQFQESNGADATEPEDFNLMYLEAYVGTIWVGATVATFVAAFGRKAVVGIVLGTLAGLAYGYAVIALFDQFDGLDMAPGIFLAFIGVVTLVIGNGMDAAAQSRWQPTPVYVAR
jgi:hypothetical protein